MSITTRDDYGVSYMNGEKGARGDEEKNAGKGTLAGNR
jgi:hypothetical protein